MGVTLLPLALLAGSLTDGPAGGHAGGYELQRSIAGTVWEGSDSEGKLVLRFERGGTLCYTVPSGTWRNGTWKQQGARVYLEMNGRYAEYHGLLRGDRIAGGGGNVRGDKWGWVVWPAAGRAKK